MERDRKFSNPQTWCEFQRLAGHHFNSCHHRLVQLLCLKDLHLGSGDGWPAAAGGLPLRSALRSFRPYLRILNFLSRKEDAATHTFTQRVL